MDAREAERRRNDRRRSDRGGMQGRRRDDADAAANAAVESHFDPGWLASGDAPIDSRFIDRQSRRLVQAQDTAFVRVYRTYVAARAAVGVGLVAVPSVSGLSGLRTSEALVLVSLAYAVQAITMWLLPRFGTLAVASNPFVLQARQRRRQWLATIGVDLIAFTLLHLLEAGSS